MSYYENLTVEEQGKVLAAMAGLKLNAKSGAPITRKDVNVAFLQATGKPLTIDMMRDPSVVQLMSTITPGTGATGTFSRGRSSGSMPDPVTSITDRNLAARGLPVPKASNPAPMGSTRYSAASASGTRFGR